MNINEEKNSELKPIFYEFNRKILLIGDFLELSRWSIEDFVQRLSEDVTKKEILERYSENFDEWYKESISFLPGFLYESILLLIWSCFMGLLKKTVDILGTAKPLVFNSKGKKPPEYIILLRKIENFGIKISLGLEEMKILQDMNELRNEIMHKTRGEDLILESKILNFEECEYFLIRMKEISRTLENVVLDTHH